MKTKAKLATKGTNGAKGRQGVTGAEAPRLRVLHSSASVEWATPQDFYDRQHAIHGFTLDVCATKKNAKCAKFFTKADNGLAQDWGQHRVWMNPPYGRGIGLWMRKAYEESRRGAHVVCLVPARTCTAWFHDYAQRGRVTFIRGRLKFGGCKNAAPFPSLLVEFNPRHTERHRN